MLLLENLFLHMCFPVNCCSVVILLVVSWSECGLIFFVLLKLLATEINCIGLLIYSLDVTQSCLSFNCLTLHPECFVSFPCTVVTLAWHLFIRVDAANEVVYELVAEPVQEPQAGEQQEETVEQAQEEVANPADLQGKPWSITLTFSIQCLSKYCAFTFIGVV